MTAVATATYTAANWNTYIRDNLNASGVGVVNATSRHIATTGVNGVAERVASTSTVISSQSTASATYVDLATIGPAVTVTTGTKAFVMISAEVTTGTAGLGARASVAVSGATTSAAGDANSFLAESGVAGDLFKGSWSTIFDPINAGANTFTLKYRTTAGGGTSTFLNRNVSVIPF